jgi:methionyl-tRNA formyltransferase
VALFGYGSLGAAAFDLLPELGVETAAVFTHAEDKEEARWFRSLADLAERAGVPVVLLPAHRRVDPAAPLQAIAPDLVLSAGFRSPIAGSCLIQPRLGAFNVHPSLLPRYRGRSPVNWAVLHGEAETGLTLHHMVEAVDAGDVVMARRVAIGPSETAFEVLARLERELRPLLSEALPLILAGAAPRQPQDPSAATYFGGRRPEDGLIDWSWPARRIHDLVRAVSRPFPGAFARRWGRTVHIWRSEPAVGPPHAAAGEGVALAPRRFAIAAGDGLLEVLSFSFGPSQPECPGVELREFWRGELA